MHKILILRSEEDISHSRDIVKALGHLVKMKEAVLFSIDTIPIGSNIEESLVEYAANATHSITLLSMNVDLNLLDFLDKLLMENVSGLGVYLSYVDDEFKDEFRKRLEGIVPINPIKSYEDYSEALADVVNYIRIWLKKK